MAQLMSIKRNVEMCPGQVSVPAIYHVSQGDKGTRIILGLVNNSANYTIPEGTTATIRGHRADGTLFTEITADVETTEVKFNLTEDMSAVPGRAECEAVLVSGSANAIGTANFIIDVEKSPASIGSVFPATDAATTWLIDKLENEPLNALDGESVVDAINDNVGLTEDIKTALLACFENVAWVNDDGQNYYNALYEAMYNTTWQVVNTLTNCITSNPSTSVTKNDPYYAIIIPATGYKLSGAQISVVMSGVDITSAVYDNGVISIQSVTGALEITVNAVALDYSINATFTQGQYVFYDFDDLDSLKDHLVVTIDYEDGSSYVIPQDDYVLTGTMTAGTSEITASYSGKSDTFTVTVSSLPALPSGYTAYDYIYNNKIGGSGTINNGVCLDTGLDAGVYSLTSYSHDVKFSASNVTNIATSSIYGTRAGTGDANLPNSRTLFIAYSSATNTRYMNAQYNGSNVNISNDITQGALYDFVSKDKNIYLNKELILENVQGEEYTPASITIALFGEHRDNYYAVKATIRIYHFIVRNNYGEAVAAMFPCTDSNNSPGLYDVIRNTFKQGKTASYLTVGND